MDEFLKTQDFMILGHSISKGQRQSAIMTITKMQKTLQELGFHDWDKNLTMLRQCVIKKIRLPHRMRWQQL